MFRLDLGSCAKDPSPRSDIAPTSSRTSGEYDHKLSEPLLRRLQERSLVCLPVRSSNAPSESIVVSKPTATLASFDDPDTDENVLYESGRLVGATFLKAIQHITAAERLVKGMSACEWLGIAHPITEEMDALVLCYRTVSSPDNFLEMLILRYGSGASRPHIQAKSVHELHTAVNLTSVLVVLKRWMRVAPSDFTCEHYTISEDLRGRRSYSWSN